MAEENDMLSCFWKLFHAQELLHLFLKSYTDAADHFPFILISFFQEAYSKNTPFLPEEALFTLENISARVKPEKLFLRWKSSVEIDSPRLQRKVIGNIYIYKLFLNDIFILWKRHF